MCQKAPTRVRAMAVGMVLSLTFVCLPPCLAFMGPLGGRPVAGRGLSIVGGSGNIGSSGSICSRSSRSCTDRGRTVAGRRCRAANSSRRWAVKPGNVVQRPTDKGPCELELFCPAKINLFLRMMGKRPDNYNELASLFQTVGFGDKLFFYRLGPDAQDDSMSCTNTDLPTGKTNLIIRAIEVYREVTGIEDYFHIHVEKRIPPQAGMGGGSANAATTLFGLNELCGRQCTQEQLGEMGAELGSDVTFFFSRGTSYCTGRGEILRNVKPLPQTQVWLIKIREGLSTPLVFKSLDYDMVSSVDPEQLLKEFMEKEDPAEATYINDLEVPAFKVLPKLAEVKKDLEAYGFPRVMMSGSGSTIFCIGLPSGELAASWPRPFLVKWDCSIWVTTFISRPEDEHLWYKQETPYAPPTEAISGSSSSSSSNGGGVSPPPA